MNFGLHVELLANVAGGEPSELDASLERLMDELHAMQNGQDLLDCSVGASTRFDGLTAEVEVDMTVVAATADAAFGVGMTWLRAAAHASGAATPDWENARPGAGAVVFGTPNVSLSAIAD